MIYNAHQPADTTDLPLQKIAPTYKSSLAVNPSLQYSTTFFDLMLSRLHRWRHNGLRRLDLRRTEHTWNPPIHLRIINPITEKVEVQGFKLAGGLYGYVGSFNGVLWGSLNDSNASFLGPNENGDIQPEKTYRVVATNFQAIRSP
jgi:hypothetical protein